VGFQHQVRVRYGECDMQGVVFNAHYLAYIDDATDTWFRSVLGHAFEHEGFDIMLKKAVVEWQAALRFGEHAVLTCSIARWGRSSFDLFVSGTVDDEERFTATITYVCVHHGTTEPLPVPESARVALTGSAVTAPAPAT
jgi:acyl-CoA thioester hydrolase